jgi:hypothetical protein
MAPLSISYADGETYSPVNIAGLLTEIKAARGGLASAGARQFVFGAFPCWTLS